MTDPQLTRADAHARADSHRIVTESSMTADSVMARRDTGTASDES